MNSSPTIAQLSEALSKAQAEMEAAKKDSDNPFFKSKYADLASVWDACRGPLGRHGLAVVQMPETVADVAGVVITTMLLHSSGEWIASQLRMLPVKDDPQGIGSAITYGRRYALAAAVGIAPEDDDGNAATGKTGKPETLTEAAKVLTRPKAAPAAAPAQAAKPAIPTAILSATDESAEFIDRGMQVNFATIFRESLAPAFRGEAEVLRHEWLAARGFIDDDGNPSSKRIPRKDYVATRQLAAQWAREYSDGQVSAL